VIVNNSTNINSQQSTLPQTTEYKKETITYDFGNSGPGLGQEQKCGRVKPAKIGSPKSIHT